MKLIERIYNHQKKIAVILAIITALAVEEHYIGFGKEIGSNLYKRYEDFCGRYFNPNHFTPENLN